MMKKKYRLVSTGAIAVLALLAVPAGVANADTSDPTDKVSYDRQIVLPAEFLTTGKVTAKIGSGATAVWAPVKATIVCSPVCIYMNPPENVTRLRVVNPKTKETSVYLIARVEPGAPLSAVPLSEIVDETYPN